VDLARQRIKQLGKLTTNKRAQFFISSCIMILLAVIIFRNWLFTSQWPAGGDILGWISRSYILDKDFRWLKLWRPYSFGFVEGINSMDIFNAFSNWVFGNPATAVKAFTFSLFLVAGFSMYAFAYCYSKNHLAALSASLVYILNQWLFSQLTEGHVDIIFSYAIFPLVFLLVDRFLKTNKIKDGLVAALALSLLLTGFHPEFTVIYGTFLLIFLLSRIIMSFFREGSKNLVQRTKTFARKLIIIIVPFLLLSSFWLIPFLLSVRSPYLSPTYTYPLEDAAKISYQNIGDAFALRSWEVWGYKQVVDVQNGIGFPGFPVFSVWFIILLACISVIFFRRDRYTVIFTFSVFVSAIVASGPNSPIGNIFVWAWFNVPHFAVFRAASRWIAIAAFCYAFLISVFVSLSTKFIKRTKMNKFEDVYYQRAKVAREGESREAYVPAVSLNKAVRHLHKLLYYLAFSLLILILLAGFFSCYFFFNKGLQVYTPPETYLAPYNWVANYQGDYKVVTASNSPSEWMNLPYQESDFASGGMLTDVGWGHDLGYDSSFIHDKPTLQDGGWNPSARYFVDYLRFRLARQSLTKNMAEMLGTLGYKFIILPNYASDNIRNFFMNQEGVKTVFANGSVILENEFFTPRIFPTGEYAVVVGGSEAFPSLCAIDNFRLNKTALLFADQVVGTPDNKTIFDGSNAMVFVDSDLLDLIMLQLQGETVLEYASDYTFSSLNYTGYWVSWPSWHTVGGFTLGRNVATTFGRNTMTIPFQLSSEGLRDIWIRVGFADGRGELSVYVDETLVGKLRPSSNFWSGLRWLNLTQLDLTAGQHTMRLTNDGTGYNDVDAMSIVDPTLFRQKSDEVLDFFGKYQGRTIYLLQAESAFNYSQGYFANTFPFEGYTLSSDGSASQLQQPSAHFFVPKQGRYIIGVRLLFGPSRGLVDLDVAGEGFQVYCYSPNTEFKWVTLGPLTMDIGEKTMTLDTAGRVDIDEIAICSLKGSEDSLSTNNLFSSDTNPVQSLTIEKEGSYKYTVQVSNTAPFLLTFSDSYNPLWKAYVDGTEIQPIVAYSFVNGFFINKTGQFNIVLYFTGQTYADIGIWISVASLLVTSVLLVTPTRIFSKSNRILKTEPLASYPSQ
jgi:hypothetical protein